MLRGRWPGFGVRDVRACPARSGPLPPPAGTQTAPGTGDLIGQLLNGIPTPAPSTTNTIQYAGAGMPDWSQKGRINILVLGSDTRNTTTDPTTGLINTNVMMVVSIDPYARIVHLLSIPRNLTVQLPGNCGVFRINEAYPCGGAAGAEEVVTGLTGIPINYYILLNMTAFAQMVDDVGGVTVDVVNPVRDDSYPGPDYSYEHLLIEPGPQHLDGADALRFARTRHADSDFYRDQRQQEVIQALRTQLLSQQPGIGGRRLASSTWGCNRCTPTCPSASSTSWPRRSRRCISRRLTTSSSART